MRPPAVALALLFALAAPTALSVGIYQQPPHFVAQGPGTFALDATSDCEGEGEYLFAWEPPRVDHVLVRGDAEFTGVGFCPDSTVPVHAHHAFSARDCEPVGQTGVACAGEGVSFRLEDSGAFAFEELYSDGQHLRVDGTIAFRQGTSDL